VPEEQAVAEAVSERKRRSNPLRLVGLIASVLVLTLLAALAVSFATVMLSREKLERIGNILVAGPEVAKSAAEKPTGVFADVTTSLELAEALRKAQQSIDEKQLGLRSELDNLRQLKTELDRFRVELADERALLEKRRKAFTESYTDYLTRTTSQGFQDAVALYGRLESRNVAAMFLGKPKEETTTVVEIVRALKPSTAAEILTEMQRIEEESGVSAGATRAAAVIDLIRQGEPVIAKPALSSELGAP